VKADSRCRLRQGRTRHQARPCKQPADPQRHGAARRGGGIRQGHGQLHAVVDVAETRTCCASSCRPSCWAFPSTSCASSPLTWAAASAARSSATPDETMGLLAASRVGRPIKWNRRTVRVVHDRLPRPRPRHPRRAGARQRTASSWRSRSIPSPTWARISRPSRRRCRPISTPRCWPASTRRRSSTPM